MFLSSVGPRRRWVAGLTAAAVAALGLPLIATPASADSAPVPPVTVRTVTADSLPTVQINGVAWDQVVVGNRVYVTGSFTSARPAGAAAGASETPRSNILAYDLTTGALINNWSPSLNGQGLTIDASADGSRIYVGGEFTTVSGTSRPRLAALDASTGALITTFNPGVNSRVRAIDVVDDTVYAGGAFTTIAGQARNRLAAFTASTGALLPWAPSVDSEVFAIVAPPGTGRVVAGGRFEFANGQRVLGLAALDASSAALQPWEAYGVFPNYGPNSSIYSLSSDGVQVFGTAYDFGGPSPFEGSFGVDLMTGRVNWVNGCKGDTYDAVPIGDVLYSTGHPHDCGMIGGHPQANPDWTFQRAMATTKSAAADGRANTYGSYAGRPAPELLHWLPTLAMGSFTGQFQAGWTVTGNSEYVVLGGEFPRVNGVAQQGLTRFRINGPNQEGPQGVTEMQPTVVSLAPGAVRVAWTAAWDRDNRQLTYEVLRGGNANTAAVVGSVTADSAWWDRKPLAFTDVSAAPGSSQTYRVRAKDAFGNLVVGASRTVAVEAGTAQPSPYGDAVRADAPTSYWRLGEPSGSVGYDWSGGSDLTLDASATRGTQGALAEQNTATTFAGSAGVPATTAAAQNGPKTFSVEAWFKTTTTSGGKIIGFGNSSTGNSTSYDRHVYMTNDGRIVFGVYPGTVRTVTSGPGLNDDKWHHVVGTLSGAGQELFIDGERVGQRTDTTTAQVYSGVWRVGGDSLGGWPNQPASAKFAGAIDEVAVYPTALALTRVQAHFTAAGGQVNAAPTAAFTATPTNLTVAVDGSGSTDPDGTISTYTWEFGDSGTATGATASHTYAAAGTYDVTLTVTDNGGATGTTTKQVTVAAEPPPATYATDSFNRTTVSGLGTADIGGAWTVSGSAANYSVSDGVGRIQANVAGAQRTAYLDAVSQTETDVNLAVSLDKVQTGGGTYVSVLGRRVGTSGYYAVKLRFLAGGALSAQLVRVVGTTETALGTATVSGISYAPGEVLWIRLQVKGTGTTDLSTKVWRQGAAEPAAWLLTRTDTTAALQAPGAVGMVVYLSGSSTNAPMTAMVDDFVAGPPPAL
jgi:hypothetical protein